MKRRVFGLVFMLLLAFGAKAQKMNQLSLQFSYNQLELGYQRNLLFHNMWGEAFVGIGNQDINSRFDDFLAGVRVGVYAFSTEKNVVALNAVAGVYIPNNSYYNAAAPLLGGGIRYVRFIGRQNRHSVLISAGYQYGKREYKQEYHSEALQVESIGVFKVAPLYFSVGYGFNF